MRDYTGQISNTVVPPGLCGPTYPQRLGGACPRRRPTPAGLVCADPAAATAANRWRGEVDPLHDVACCCRRPDLPQFLLRSAADRT